MSKKFFNFLLNLSIRESSQNCPPHSYIESSSLKSKHENSDVVKLQEIPIGDLRRLWSNWHLQSQLDNRTQRSLFNWMPTRPGHKLFLAFSQKYNIKIRSISRKRILETFLSQFFVTYINFHRSRGGVSSSEELFDSSIQSNDAAIFQDATSPSMQ